MGLGEAATEMGVRGILIVALLIAVAVWIAVVTTRAQPIAEVSRAWALSGHADRAAPAFTAWDGDDPPVIPPNCAACHSLNGFLDAVGEDGTPAGTVESSHPTGSVVSCLVCHNGAAHGLRAVSFPSGAQADVLDAEGPCLTCHQGLRSDEDVRAATAGREADTVDEALPFINVHYGVAAATLMGGDGRGAYQYEGQPYAGRYLHVSDLRTCNQCHDPHSLQLAPKECSPCHLNVVDRQDLAEIRAAAVDYDGDGSAAEGIAGEIETMHEAVYRALQAYARDVVGTPLVYVPGRSPFWFVDTNDDGEAQAGEIAAANAYTAWTPRALRVAYNYHLVHEDPGAYAHNPGYVLQSLYDGLRDLGERVEVPLAEMTRP